MAGLREEFDDIVDHRRVTTLFQPVVDLRTTRVIGYEALTRGPRGSSFEQPMKLFTYAYRVGRSAELDWVCRATAMRAALLNRMPPEVTLFLNAEPVSVGVDCPDDLLDTIVVGARQLSVVVELTERNLTHDPAGVLHAAFLARANGIGIAIDDVGAEPASLAMMPLVRPDVIKLDLSLIQNRPDLVVARTVNGVLAEVERTGATVLAEGIESPRHATMALAMGATLGQGWLYGRPAPLPHDWSSSAGAGTLTISHDPLSSRTPFEVVTAERPTRPANRQLLASMSRHLEYRAADPAEPSVLVACFQDARRFSPALAQRYASLAAASVMVATFAVDMPDEPADGVRGTALRADDPLARDWVVVVVGPHFGAALVARQPRPADDAPFDYAVTYERDLVIAAAQSLVRRIEA
ncbi:EAL domain, c-di-GMP-specific phosphodiesterase class I (or its enzymatically inactive variant) [Asanoa hainanensis]|uniref:EAL domain, c-di-GMP-specific phosphodiesterase class I (Or its enzymatically inactive variant) n=1 Tax=Asanoa hainanensis TaxID=560556 RepID=A0A239FSS1_9ACTN|nr:EAL domain, c-di-GMP-specific phosphodiesterase class I (or its enzymatically inactive variant) [Asanoa hainanensis]